MSDPDYDAAVDRLRQIAQPPCDCCPDPGEGKATVERVDVFDLLTLLDQKSKEIEDLVASGRTILDSLGEYVRQSMHQNPEWREGALALDRLVRKHPLPTGRCFDHSTPLQAGELEDLKQKLAAATSGSWMLRDVSIPKRGGSSPDYVVKDEEGEILLESGQHNPNGVEDLQFAAAAKNAVPKLLQLLERRNHANG